MATYVFERECRTPYSEAYTVLDGDKPVARVDLHYTPTVVHGTINVAESVTQEEVQALIEAVDEELVMSTDSAREDFIVVVYQGREIGTYSDQDFEQEEEEGAGGKPGW